MQRLGRRTIARVHHVMIVKSRLLPNHGLTEELSILSRLSIVFNPEITIKRIIEHLLRCVLLRHNSFNFRTAETLVAKLKRVIQIRPWVLLCLINIETGHWFRRHFLVHLRLIAFLNQIHSVAALPYLWVLHIAALAWFLRSPSALSIRTRLNDNLLQLTRSPHAILDLQLLLLLQLLKLLLVIGLLIYWTQTRMLRQRLPFRKVLLILLSLRCLLNHLKLLIIVAVRTNRQLALSTLYALGSQTHIMMSVLIRSRTLHLLNH